MLVSDFKLTHPIARNIAEGMWGRGGTSSTHYPFPGIFYFSCSGHGGYIVDGMFFSPQEIEFLAKYGFYPEHLYLRYVTSLKSPVELAGISYSNFSCYAKSLPAKFYSKNQSFIDVRWGWVYYPIYLFEEDCDWAMLEMMRPDILAVSLANHNMLNDEYSQMVFNTFNRWIVRRDQ